MAYDALFRKHVIEYKNGGYIFKEVNETSGIDSKRYYSWKKQLEQTGSLEYKSPQERRGKINKSELACLLEEHPGWYLRAFAERLQVCPQGIHKIVTVKKRLPIWKSLRKNGKSF
jgi:transposase